MGGFCALFCLGQVQEKRKGGNSEGTVHKKKEAEGTEIPGKELRVTEQELICEHK